MASEPHAVIGRREGTQQRGGMLGKGEEETSGLEVNQESEGLNYHSDSISVSCMAKGGTRHLIWAPTPLFFSSCSLPYQNLEPHRYLVCLLRINILAPFTDFIFSPIIHRPTS